MSHTKRSLAFLLEPVPYHQYPTDELLAQIETMNIQLVYLRNEGLWARKMRQQFYYDECFQAWCAVYNDYELISKLIIARMGGAL